MLQLEFEEDAERNQLWGCGGFICFKSHLVAFYLVAIYLHNIKWQQHGRFLLLLFVNVRVTTRTEM